MNTEDPADQKDYSGKILLEFSTDTLVWRRLFRGEKTQQSAARWLIRLLLQGCRRVEDAEWIVSELSANAICHTRSGQPGGVFAVEVLRRSQVARIAVYDQGGAGVPCIAPPGDGEPAGEHGHGLRGVAVLASRIGIRGNPEIGHAVWVSLPLLEAAPEVAAS